jgi:hypothetical protein
MDRYLKGELKWDGAQVPTDPKAPGIQWEGRFDKTKR